MLPILSKIPKSQNLPSSDRSIDSQEDTDAESLTENASCQVAESPAHYRGV
jgi:hypothetical protein